jgi:hypothetical protein
MIDANAELQELDRRLLELEMTLDRRYRRRRLLIVVVAFIAGAVAGFLS